MDQQIEQALNILRTALDAANSKGVFLTLNDSVTVANAYNTIFTGYQQLLTKKPDENEQV